MNPNTVMVVAGDPSGDALGAGLARALAAALPGTRFIGAGGPKMAEAGVDIVFDLTAEAVIGLVLMKLPRFFRLARQLKQLALEQKPDVIVLVDFNFFNLHLARAIRRCGSPGWRPALIKYVSPQVWGSRPWRAAKMARDFDLLLCLFPFEKDWYHRHVPGFPVEFVGHSMFDTSLASAPNPGSVPQVLLLPGSRRAEIRRHLPVMLGAASLIAAKQPARFTIVAPNEKIAALVRANMGSQKSEIGIQIGGMDEALAGAAVAITKTGTVTLECARFGVPAVALYKTSFWTYWIARQVVTVDYLSMPNLLANEPLYPEFIQGEATAANIAGAALELLSNPARRAEIQSKLAGVISTLGGPGAAQRAAAAIMKLLSSSSAHPLLRHRDAEEA